MRIRIDKSKIKQIGYSLKENASDIEKQTVNISNIINDLSEAWEGTDYKECRNKVNDKLIPSLKKSYTAIDKLGNYLIKVPNSYDSVDSLYESKIKTKK